MLTSMVLRYHDPIDRVRPVCLVLQRSSQFRYEGDCPFLPLDDIEGNAADPGAPFVGTDKVVGMIEDVCPVNLVVNSEGSALEIRKL